MKTNIMELVHRETPGDERKQDMSTIILLNKYPEVPRM